MEFLRLCWPDITLYKEQRDIIYSVRDNIETYVPAGNKLGKDFVGAFIALWFFCTRRPARIVTTSVSESQLIDVLWGEIYRFIQLSKFELPIHYNIKKIRQVTEDGVFVPRCELVAKVVKQGEGLLGRHLETYGNPKQGGDGMNCPRTLIIFDEASGIDDRTYESCLTWSHRRLIIGNPWPCSNFFYKGVTAGDLLLKDVL